MNTRLLLLLSFGVSACLSGAFAQSQNPAQHKVSQPVQKSTAPSKVDGVIKVLESATSLKQVNDAFVAANLSKTEIETLQNRVNASAPLKQKLDRLQSDQRATFKVQADQFKHQAPVRIKALLARLNDRRLADFKKQISAIKQTNVGIITNPAVSCKADATSIASVSPVTPGVEFHVDGKGFGEIAGSVQLMTGGQVFTAYVTAWNSCGCYALCDDNTIGVVPDPQALIVITTSDGRKTRAATNFTPIIDTVEETESDEADGFYFGRSEDWTYWNYTLKNDWYVVSTSLDHWGGGHAEITSAPATNVPGGAATTKVHAGVAGVGCSCFTVTLSLAGPKGLPYK